MACIGVSESGGNLAFVLKKTFDKLGHSEFGVKLAESGGVFDAVLVGNPPPNRQDKFTAKALIVPDCMDASEVSPHLASSVISYGLRRKNTITASSLIGSHLVVSVQRSIPTVGGKIVGDQEFIVNVCHGEHSDEILGIIASLLALDISPEEISKLTFDF